MFVTFNAGHGVEEEGRKKRTRSTPRACQPCRRRKVRCDGKLPCTACQTLTKATHCTYGDSRQVFRGDRVGDDEPTLEQLQLLPRKENEATEGPPSQDEEDGVTDDVNALSLSVKHTTTYLGVSSVVAVFRVIHTLAPNSHVFSATSRKPNESDHHPHPHHPSQVVAPKVSDGVVMADDVSLWQEVPAINAYFQYFHPLFPLLEEKAFRDTYTSRQRGDWRWQLLLNAVLAMGSVALHDATDRTHAIYYERAELHLGLRVFRSAHLETVQALAILSGMYLHYVQRPNLANVLMGAVWRMSTSLGLHRDFSEGLKPADVQATSGSIELRRRVWWCLAIMDGWNSIYLGRPTISRTGPGHTTKLPETACSGSSIITALLCENIELCTLSTRFENAVAETPLISLLDRQGLDAAFADWYRRSSSRSGLHDSSDDTPGVISAKHTIRWKGLSSRIFIHRPVLLWYAMRKTNDRLSDDRREALETCRALANQLICDIQTTWHKPKPCQMSGWCATWQLYQAALVPLLSLFCDPHDEAVVKSSSMHVEIALSTLTELYRWSPTAQRSLQVLVRLYDAARCFERDNEGLDHNHGQRSSDTSPTNYSATMYDGFFMHSILGNPDEDYEEAQNPTYPDAELSLLDYWDIGQEINTAP